MQLTETARVRLLIDGKEAISELSILERKFDEANEAKKKFARSSNEFKELNAETKELAKSIALVRERMDVANMTTKEAARYQKDLILAFKDLKKGTEDYALASKKLTEVNTHLASLRQDMNAVNTEVVKQKSTWDNLKGWMVGAFTVVAIQEFGRRLFDLGMGVFDITAKFERYDAVLGNATGSAALAAKAMADIKDMAATTPFTVDELTDSYVKFANRGLNPTRAEMKAMADVAATAGKSFEQLSEALLDGAMGQLKRFTELGISAEKMGDKIKLSFKGVSTTVSMDLEGMNKAMMYFQQNAKGVAGATDVIAKTMEGRVSNLKDLWDFARIELGNKIKPLFDDIIDGLYGMVEGVKFFAQNFERMAAIAKTVTAAFVAYHVITRASAMALATKNGLLSIQRILYGQSLIALEAYTGMTIAETEAQIAATTAARSFNAAIMANPLMAFLSVLTLLVTGYQVYKMSVEDAHRKQAEFNNGLASAIAPINQERDSFNNLAKSVLDTNEKLDVRKAHLDELKKKYPDQMKGITDLKDAENELGRIIRLTNIDFVTRAKLLENEYRIKHNNTLYDKAMAEKLNLESQLKNAGTRNTTMVTGTAGYVETYDSEKTTITKRLAEQQKILDTVTKFNQNIADQSEKLTKKIVYDYKTQNEAAAGAADGDGKAAKKRKATAEQLAKDLAKAHTDMLKAIEKANELADKTMRKSLQEQVKSIKANSADELKAREKLDDEIRENALKMASFKDAAMKLERIKLAKSVEEIEAIEKEYLEKSLKRELESAKEKLASKEREYKMLKAMGLLYKEEDDKRSAEILKLKSEVAEKEVAIVKQGIAEKTKITKESDKASEDATKEYNQRRKDGLKQQMDYEAMAWEMFGKSLKDLSDLQNEELEASAEKKKQLAESMANAIVDATEEIFSFFNEKISEELDKADNAVEKFLAEQSQKDAKYAQGMMKGVVKAASGDLAGGLLAIGTSLSQWVYGQITYASNLAEAHAQLQIERMSKNMEVLTGKITEVSSKLTSAGEIYGKMAEVNPFDGIGDASDKLSEIYQNLLVIVPTVGELAERGEKSGLSLIESEIKIGEQIVSNYNLAIDREETLNREILDNIQTQNNEAVAAINKKYDMESTRAAGAFAADNLGILQSTNAALMAFVTVEDTKTSLMADYSQRRSDITAIYADKIRPITAEMSEAEVAGIQAATKARDEAYAGVEAWLTKELQFVLGNEEQKRESYTATQKIIKDGEYETDLLRETYKANELDRNTKRDLELLAAFASFNTSKAAEEQRHKDEMTALQKAYEDAIAASYERLKNNMVTAIDQMQARYSAMIAAGVADTGELFAAIQNLRAQYDSLFGAMNTPLRTDYTNNPTPDNTKPTNTPRFADGGIMKASDYFENHGVLGGLSHNTPEGGNWVINARTGRIQAKVEAGEWMGIVNKKTTARYANLLSYLANSSVATTGKPVYAENGYFGTPTPVDGSAKSFTSTTTTIPVFEGFGELVGLMREFIAKVEMSNELLGAVAISSYEAAKKSLVISVNNILDAADIVADVDRRSSFS